MKNEFMNFELSTGFDVDSNTEILEKVSISEDSARAIIASYIEGLSYGEAKGFIFQYGSI